MHTEHLTNVHPVRVMAGWLVALAVSGVALFAFVALGFMGPETSARSDAIAAVTAVAAGFLVGGWFTGARTVEAPILHGIALGLTSLMAWVLLNFVAVAFGMDDWSGLGGTATLAVVLVQIAAAVVGCWLGTAQARRKAEEWSASPATGVRERGEE